MTIEISASPRPVIPCENPDLSMRFRIFRESLVRRFTRKSAYDRNDADLQALFQDHDQSIEKQCDALTRYIAEAFDHYAAWDYSHAYYPGRPSQQTARTDALEGSSRVIPVLAAWLHSQVEMQVETKFERKSAKQGELITLNGQKLNIPEIVKSAFLAGTNPNHRGYWGKLESYDQKICESADLALALWISKDWVWNTLTDNERRQITDWFLQVNPLSTVYLLVTSPHPLSFGRCGGGLVVLPSLSIRPAIQVCLCVLNHTSHLLWQRYGEAKTV